MSELIDNNRKWAARKVSQDPEFFSRLANQQNPEYLWIGCSDSRVPANQITGLAPGEVFVHRNVANLVVQTDFNLLSVLQFAVDVLKVRHVIVCGHYNCGGVKAAMDNARFGLIDNWLRHIQNIQRRGKASLDGLDPALAADRLCEMNVVANAENVARTTIVQDAWLRGQKLDIHSWIYRLDTGLISSLRNAIKDDASVPAEGELWTGPA
ncbi:carbonate dehydratase [Haloferula rosea]|uniref:Carbonic anhydrase n=1 Tax=Haloferula rosea TaxID=490093 RepID=A0A934VEG6_9BACT|nr:carbonate dehydratase [Haloferula rosea]MBK1826021.1 carbonate dehydratase [Haloferula rosea]